MNIEVVAKPEWVSWDVISDVLQRAHKKNIEKGFVQNTAYITGDEIKKKVSSGQCFVAMEGDEVVGTSSVVAKKLNTWYVNGVVLYYLLSGILPEHQGKGIYSKLLSARENYAREHGIDVVYMYTSEKNIKMQKIASKVGFQLVSCAVFPRNNYYSVVMAKWLDGCPYSNLYCKIRFLFSKCYIKLRYKPGAVKRFGI